MPLYGSKLYYILFENMGQLTEIMIRDEIENALTNWEPRININEIVIAKTTNTWKVTLHYKVIRIDLDDTLDITLNKIG